MNRKTSVKVQVQVKPCSRAWRELPSKRESKIKKINDTESEKANAIDDVVELGCTASADHICVPSIEIGNSRKVMDQYELNIATNHGVGSWKLVGQRFWGTTKIRSTEIPWTKTNQGYGADSKDSWAIHGQDRVILATVCDKYQNIMKYGESAVLQISR